MLTFFEARARLLASARPLAAERVSLESALGRVLAETAIASGPLPRFDFSAMDGYALAASGADGATLAVVGEARAGGPRPAAVAPGTTCRIWTGAPIPAGCDAVVPQEEVTLEGGRVAFTRAPRAGQHIRRRGEDIAEGAEAVARGTRLGPAHIGLLAALDARDALVGARPRVALLTTGDELRRPGEPPREGSIPDANGPMLAALVAACGGIATRHHVVADDLEATRRAVAAALEAADVLVTAGGVSVGERDVVRDALTAEGVTFDVVKVAIKPGKPLVVGRRGDAHVLALPGNPAAAFVTFATFGAPLLRALQGDARPLPAPLRARLTREARCPSGKIELARASLALDGDGLAVTLFANQSAGALTSLAWADALALLSDPSGTLAAGSVVDVLRLADV